MKTAAMAALAVATLGSARADFVIEIGPGTLPNVENVLLNNQGLLEMGPVVQGITEKSLIIVDYYGAGEDLAAGKARVSALDAVMTTLSITPNDPTLGFLEYQLNLTAFDEGPATFDVYNDGALVQTAMFDIGLRGPNFIKIYSTGKETFDAITITMDAGFTDIRQNRAFIVPDFVPEPATLAVLGIGIATLLRRRR
jgi:hypothetical protein